MSNSAISSIAALRAQALRLLDSQGGVALLLGRLAIGLVFVSTGWGKIHNLDRVTMFFESLGIPAPGPQALLVSFTELFGGAALCLGLLTRFAALPLAVTMVVAILTAKLEDIHGIFDLVGAEEFTYLVLLLMLAILGPGKLSLDYLVARKLSAADGSSSVRSTSATGAVRTV